MKVIHTIDELRSVINNEKSKSKTVGFVPTMGALHEGHLSLIKKSASENDFTVVSVFVNPIQFGPNEDYEKYPRTLPEDSKICEEGNADILFAPSKDEVFPDKIYTYVDITDLTDNLCGLSRPGHFKGVCTIVAKLFNMVMPDRAYFGKKDIQQFYIIRKMVFDLNFQINIVGCPIIRSKDGLALSSRNKYLSDKERNDALILNRAIKEAITLINNGEKRSSVIIEKMKSMITEVRNATIDYLKIVDEKMKDVPDIKESNIIAMAVFIGKTRLIDNHIIGEEICF